MLKCSRGVGGGGGVARDSREGGRVIITRRRGEGCQLQSAPSGSDVGV